jgi:hypothetical protein
MRRNPKVAPKFCRACVATVFRQMQGNRPTKHIPSSINHTEAPMRQLNVEAKQLCQRHSDGSLNARADRQRLLDRMARQLHELEFLHLHADCLDPGSVETLVARWIAMLKRP